MPDIASLTADDFDACKGRRFVAAALDGAAASFPVTLREVRRLPGNPGFREPFALELLGPPAPVNRQGVYRLSEPGLGELDLFLVPVSASPEGVTYEITFG